MSISKNDIADWFRSLQLAICKSLEDADGGAVFVEDKWSREEGGGGMTRVIQHGNVIEKGGVNFSAVHGDLPAFLNGDDTKGATTFFATGVSIVIHPKNPMVPIIHMNVRYFEMDNGVSWFGGGIDLTPHYVDETDACYFHQQLKKTCDKFDSAYYPKFKTWADDYFFIKHRNETRGIGGIFFDHLKPNADKSKEQLFAFVKAVGETFAPTYVHLINKNKELYYTPEHKQWQLIRRGRYVEFNLVYDRGTKFGLETNGRIESILMSLPETASWMYDHKAKVSSAEAKTLSYLKKGIDWVA